MRLPSRPGNGRDPASAATASRSAGDSGRQGWTDNTGPARRDQQGAVGAVQQEVGVAAGQQPGGCRGPGIGGGAEGRFVPGQDPRLADWCPHRCQRAAELLERRGGGTASGARSEAARRARQPAAGTPVLAAGSGRAGPRSHRAFQASPGQPGREPVQRPDSVLHHGSAVMRSRSSSCQPVTLRCRSCSHSVRSICQRYHVHFGPAHQPRDEAPRNQQRTGVGGRRCQVQPGQYLPRPPLERGLPCQQILIRHT
jgi:hypothetical protein